MIRSAAAPPTPEHGDASTIDLWHFAVSGRPPARALRPAPDEARSTVAQVTLRCSPKKAMMRRRASSAEGSW